MAPMARLQAIAFTPAQLRATLPHPSGVISSKLYNKIYVTQTRSHTSTLETEVSQSMNEAP